MNRIRLNDFKIRNYVCKHYCSKSNLQRINDFPAAFKPNDVEQNWYNVWQENGFFTPKDNGRESFRIILPPPNVTGVLHLGHTLTVTIQDILARWHRMNNRPVIWSPGLDHAGIATQVVVEKYLQKTKGISRHDLGREKFISTVEEWTDEKAITIREQLKTTGASLDWHREFFTMSKNHSDAVTEAFVMLSERNLLYRDKLLVNWSPTLRSAISDIEVDHVIVSGRTDLDVPGYEAKIPFGQLFEFSYQVRDTGEELVVASTRPETMLGDVAIAVHPEDERYSHYVGSHVWHPFRKTHIPVIADSIVDKSFGSGAVKITPAHDRSDFEIARRHNLKIIDIINEEGNMTKNAGPFQGLRRFVAREKVLAELANAGALKGIRDHEMSVPRCSRSGDIVEYLLRDQWFVKCKGMAERALLAVKDGTLKIDPAVHEQTWYNWLENSRDWCISRQLWWGHRIPAYECSNGSKSTWIVARSQDEALRKAQEQLGGVIQVRQDEDILDTWFSSALLPFSTMGWPNDTEDFRKNYPLTLMETGQDILFFWVARMVMLGLELTGELPFKEVLLHGVLCDVHGRKMSKSIGNVIAPENVTKGISLQKLNEQAEKSHEAGILSSTELTRTLVTNCKMFPHGIPECGTDALRFTLCSHNIKHHNILFDVNQCFSTKLFCNKIWQASKYVLLMTDENLSKPETTTNIFDRWILSRLSVMVKTVNNALSHNDFYVGTAAIKQFVYYEFCDFYLEATKPGLKTPGSDVAQNHKHTLIKCLEVSLRTIAPITPYLADELYSRLSTKLPSFLPVQSLLEAPYPTTMEFQSLRDVHVEERVDKVWKVVSSIRKLLAYMEGKSKPEVHIVTRAPNDIDLYTECLNIITALSKVSNAKVMSDSDYVKAERSICNVIDTGCSVFLSFEEEQFKKVERKAALRRAAIEKTLKRLKKATSAPGYKANAPENVQKTHAETEKSLLLELEQMEHVYMKSK